VNVTVFPTEEGARTTTRYAPTWTPAIQPAVSLYVNVSGNAATFAGMAVVGLLVGLAVDRQTYVWRTTTTDTPSSIAANLATLLRADRIALCAGSTVTVPAAGSLRARIVADAIAMQEVRRQERDFRVSCWCSTPAVRDETASVVDSAFAASAFLSLSDRTNARIQLAGGAVLDQSENSALYRRDLIYRVEYPTVLTVAAPAMLFGESVLGGVPLLA
jgi:hypothetical protein